MTPEQRAWEEFAESIRNLVYKDVYGQQIMWAAGELKRLQRVIAADEDATILNELIQEVSAVRTENAALRSRCADVEGMAMILHNHFIDKRNSGAIARAFSAWLLGK